MASKMTQPITAIYYNHRGQAGILLHGHGTIKHIDSFKALGGTFGKTFQVPDAAGVVSAKAGWFFTEDKTNEVMELLQRINSGEEQGKKPESKWSKAPPGMQNIKLVVPVPGPTDTFNLLQGEKNTPLVLINMIETDGVVTQLNLKREGDGNILFAVPTVINGQPFWIVMTSNFEWGTLQIIKTIGTQQPFDPNVVGPAAMQGFN